MANTHVLEDAFFDRFLGFVKRYDEVHHTTLMESASNWVEQKNYDAIYYYLKLNSKGSIVCIPHVELANMKEEELFALQNFSKAVVPLLEEEKALCVEFAAYLGKPC